jgi:hypothetical protein
VRRPDRFPDLGNRSVGNHAGNRWEPKPSSVINALVIAPSPVPGTGGNQRPAQRFPVFPPLGGNRTSARGNRR